MKPQIQIVGNGSFGTFLKVLLDDQFEIVDDAESVILAVPISAYDEVSTRYRNRHLINTCKNMLSEDEFYQMCQHILKHKQLL